jgi:hypothetical protein
MVRVPTVRPGLSFDVLTLLDLDLAEGHAVA